MKWLKFDEDRCEIVVDIDAYKATLSPMYRIEAQPSSLDRTNEAKRDAPEEEQARTTRPYSWFHCKVCFQLRHKSEDGAESKGTCQDCIDNGKTNEGGSDA